MKKGGIYIASQQHMHKVVWTGEGLSTSSADGAWTAEYLNGWGHGTGATPSLMGFGEEDRFVVITDGEPQMNMLLFGEMRSPRIGSSFLTHRIVVSRASCPLLWATPR